MLFVCDCMINARIVAGGNLYDKINHQNGKLFSEEVRVHHGPCFIQTDCSLLYLLL